MRRRQGRNREGQERQMRLMYRKEEGKEERHKEHESEREREKMKGSDRMGQKDREDEKVTT